MRDWEDSEGKSKRRDGDKKVKTKECGSIQTIRQNPVQPTRFLLVCLAGCRLFVNLVRNPMDGIRGFDTTSLLSLFLLPVSFAPSAISQPDNTLIRPEACPNISGVYVLARRGRRFADE